MTVEINVNRNSGAFHSLTQMKSIPNDAYISEKYCHHEKCGESTLEADICTHMKILRKLVCDICHELFLFSAYEETFQHFM